MDFRHVFCSGDLQSASLYDKDHFVFIKRFYIIFTYQRLQQHFNQGAHHTGVFTERRRDTEPVPAGFDGITLAKHSFAGSFKYALQDMIRLMPCHITAFNGLSNGRKDIKGCPGTHIDHLITGIRLIICTVYKMVIAFFPKHHGLIYTILLLRILFHVICHGRTKTFPQLVRQSRIFFS
ncbi:hypothetical protein DXA40_08555 [Blautia sp. OF01-4LB]|nr:hypothetical protein DXA40_08555 [Blautia sp. OF01-4LB]